MPKVSESEVFILGLLAAMGCSRRTSSSTIGRVRKLAIHEPTERW